MTTSERAALEQIANCLPTDLQNPAPLELWAAKAKDCVRIARQALATPSVRVLRESHLTELVRAGDAMRAQFKHEMVITGPWTDWDAAKAAFLKGAEK
jgi:hypothetical protein